MSHRWYTECDPDDKSRKIKKLMLCCLQVSKDSRMEKFDKRTKGMWLSLGSEIFW